MKRGLLLVLLAISLLLGIRHMDTRGWIPLDKARRPHLQQVSGDRAIIAWRTSDRFIGQATVNWRLEDDPAGEAGSWNKVMGATTPSQYGERYLDKVIQDVCTKLVCIDVMMSDDYTSRNSPSTVSSGLSVSQFSPGVSFSASPGPPACW